MIIYNGLTKKKCNIQNGNIIVDGDHSVIESIEEITDYKLRMKVGLVLFVLGFIVIALFSYKLVVDVFVQSVDHSDGMVKGIICAIGILLYTLAFISFSGMLGYNNYWKINSKMIFVERDDDATNNILRTIKDSISRHKT